MLMKILPLREKGVKFAEAELLARVPLVGRVQYDDSPYDGRDGRGKRLCLVMPEDVNDLKPLLQLVRASVKIERRGIVIRGEEEFWRRSECTTYRQAIWCLPLVAGCLGADRLTMTARLVQPIDYEHAGKRASE